MPSVDLTPEPASPRRARTFVRRLLADWGVADEVGDDVEFLVSELVANAVSHARTGVTVDVSLEEGIAYIAVSDRSARMVHLRRPPVEAVTGRGVYLLDQLAREWEVLSTAQGKTVRFSLSIDSRSKVSR